MKKELNPAQVSAILRTLPVGLYLGTRAPVALDLVAPSSFCNVMTREVRVAFRNVAEAFAAAPEVPDGELEGVVRGLLYHEISHLLLTPVRISPADRLGRLGNILEDARIETLLASRFYGVNFRDLLRKVCGAPVTPARDFEHFVFNAVRYRIAPADLLAAWDSIVRKHCGNPEADGARFDSYHLIADYAAFLDMARKAFENPGAKNAKNGAGKDGEGAGKDGEGAGKDGEGAGKDGEGAGKDGEGAGKDGEGAGKDGEGAGKDGEGAGKDGESAGAKPENGNDESQNAREGGERNARGGAHAETNDDGTPSAGGAVAVPEEITEAELKNAQGLFAARLNRYNDPAVSREVSRIIVRATNRRANRSAASMGYAGRIDPRAVGVRQDFRWMARSGDEACGKFDRIALRLVVDCSGSFSRAVHKVNELISSLLEVERKMPNAFALSVVVTGSNTRVHDKAERIVADEGNCFGPGVVESFRATERPGWRNVTVAVWDGAMSHAAYVESATRRNRALHERRLTELKFHVAQWRKAYGKLDNRDTVIVSDTDNKAAFEIGCPNARKTFIKSNYAENFVGKVLDLLGGIL